MTQQNTQLAQGNGGQMTHKQKFSNLRSLLERGKDQLKLAMDAHMDPDRMIRLALTAATKNPALFDCSPESIGLAMLTASQLGIEPNGRDAHIVPYWNNKTKKREAQLLPDYKGLIRLAYQSGDVRSFQAMAVRENDTLEYEFGSNAHLKHIPATGDRGELIAAWAMVQLKDGCEQFMVLQASDVEKCRQVSQTGKKDTGPWMEWPDQMWAKTAVKALSKFVPLGVKFENAIEHDTKLDTGTIDMAFAAIEEQTDPSKSRSQQLADELGRRPNGDGKAEEPEAAAPEATEDQPKAVPTEPASSDALARLSGLIAECTTEEGCKLIGAEIEAARECEDIWETDAVSFRDELADKLNEVAGVAVP